MLFSKFLATLALLYTTTSAVPLEADHESSLKARDNMFEERGPTCLTKKDADEVAGIFQALIQNYTTELAYSALTEDFIDWSSAVNIIMNKGAQGPKNITGPTFDSRQTFMSGQGSQPKIPFQKLNTFFGCRHVALRWVTLRSANGQAREVASIPVIGNAIIAVVPAESGNKYPFRVKELFSEFNAAAWLVNLGVFKPNGTLLPVDTSQSAKRDTPSLLWDGGLEGAMI